MGKAPVQPTNGRTLLKVRIDRADEAGEILTALGTTQTKDPRDRFPESPEPHYGSPRSSWFNAHQERAMPQASVNVQSGMRRLQDLQEVEPTLQDLEKVIYGPEAAQSIVDLIRLPLAPAPRPEAILDALRQMLFEGTTTLTPNEALVRAAVIASEPHRAVMYAKSVLRYSVHFGMVALEDGPVGPRFLQLEPGIVHFPRLGAVADARTVVVVGRGVSLAALLRREAKKREQSLARRRDELLNLLVPSLARLEPTAPVPTQLKSTDHPPAETMGDFVRELPGFLEPMPSWRLGEMLMVLDHLPRRKQAQRPTPDPSSPEELNDFSLRT